MRDSTKRAFVLVLASCTLTLIAGTIFYFYRLFEETLTTEVKSISGGADAIQEEVYIKRITLSSSPSSAADLEVLHDGQKYYQSGNLFSSDLGGVYQGGGDTPSVPVIPLGLGYTLRISVATALITSVRICGSAKHDQEPLLFSTDYLQTHLWGHVVVDLCDSHTSNCFSCGSKDLANFTIDPVFKSESLAINLLVVLEAEVLCISGSNTFVDEVLVTIPNDQITPYELAVFGIEAVKDEIRNLEIRRGGEFLSHWIRVPSSIDKAIDGATETTESDCFVSTAAVGESWVSLEIPWSIVSHVNILTHQSDSEAEGLWVDVCSHGIQCLPCGVMTSTKPGHWAGVYCLGGFISGNEVQLRHKYQPMRICEIEIIGKTVAGEIRGVINQVPIITASLVHIVDLDFNYRISGMAHLVETYDSRLTRCYCTYQRILFEVELSVIHYIKLLSKSGYDGSKKLLALFITAFSALSQVLQSNRICRMVV